MIRLIVVLFSLMATTASAAPRKLPFHLDLEASGRETATLLKKQQTHFGFLASNLSPEDRELARIMEVGKRNLDWLIFINQHRETPIKFTKPGELVGIPINAPKRYSGQTVIREYNEYMAAAPAIIREVLHEGKPFTPNAPLPDEEYRQLGLKMDKIYQTAARWKLMQPWMGEMARNRQNDIRGYFFLMNEDGLEAKLIGYESLPAEKQAEIKEWLISQCFNTLADDAQCLSVFNHFAGNKNLLKMHKDYVARAQATFSELYNLQNPRRELVWNSSNVNLATIPMRTPETSAIREFLAKNIEDEWKWLGWQLRLTFTPNADVRTVWQPGITPHVNGLGGNTIYMDSNAPLTEWDVQWTIRHEFGHVLGFPDCYVEFYDSRERLMINYQIDTTDMMCSRAGKMKERIYTEMKANYLKN